VGLSTRIALFLAVAAAGPGGGLFEHFALSRQSLQMKVDAAAEHGARALLRGEDVRQAVDRHLRKLAALSPGEEAEVQSPPRQGRFRGSPRAVRVRLQKIWRAPLLPLSLGAAIPMDVRATAAFGLPSAAPNSVLRVE
jgi:hypothetical protein